MRIKLVFISLISVLSIFPSAAQKKVTYVTITGNVTDAKNDPIANAIIIIDGQKTRTVTNDKGYYKIKVTTSADKIGIFTFGYGIDEEHIGGRTSIDFNFDSDSYEKRHGRSSGLSIFEDKAKERGNESVDVGYGHIKRKNLTTDVDYIDGSNKKYATYSSVTQMILREVSGVRLERGTIIIQQSQNMGGFVPPLLIVDGTMTSIAYIDDTPPTSVASISVLKGTAAAIYGSRGYGGAIIIRTKTYDEN